MGSLRISSKILISFVIIAVTTLGLVGFLSYTIGVNTLEREAFNKLTAVREMKSSQIEEYFQFISDQILTFSEDKMIIDAMHAFADTHATIFPELDLSESTLAEWENTLTEYGRNVLLRDYYPQELETIVLQSLFIGNNPNPTGSKDLLDFPGDGSRYSAAHEIYHPIIRDYLHAFGYYDIFLVDVNSGGHIVYSVFKEVDFGTSLLDGPYADTNFGPCWWILNPIILPTMHRLHSSLLQSLMGTRKSGC
jgi:methyl-accepting chemotaxis protein